MAKLHLPTNATARLLLALGLFALAAVLSRGSAIPVWEEGVFAWIYGWPGFLAPFFIAVTQLGGVFMLLALAAACALTRKYHIMLRLLFSGMLAYLAAGVAKDLLGRPRPLELLTDITVRDFVATGPGFPSGHTALVTALALTLWPHLPRRFRWLVPFTIIGVGLSRVYLGVHAPLDVVGGLALGWASVEVFRHVDIRGRYPKKVKAKAGSRP